MFNLLISWSRLRSRAIFDCYMKKLKLLISSCRGMIRCAATAVLLTVGMAAAAQTVSISPKTGNVISAVSYDNENHVQNYGGVWVHDQLPLTLLTSDKDALTDDGLVKEHANNVGVEEGKLGLISGHGTIKNHMTLSLPKGYRFTSYKIVLNYEKWHESNNDAVATTFRETKSDFATNYASVDVEKNAKKVTLTRTSLSGDDMGNILYFLQDHENGHSTVSVESFVITFECTDKFNESLHTAVKELDKAVSCIAFPFQTHRTDLGEIEETTNEGYRSYKYNYENVKDLSADFLLYDRTGVDGSGTAVAGTPGDGAISSVYYNGQLTFVGLKNNTYWLETPTDAITQNKTRIPVGYRIVGARLLYANSAQSIGFQKGDNIYITDGNGKYMNYQLNFTTTPVQWTYGTDGKVSTKGSRNQKVYLLHKINTNFWGEVTSISLSTTTNADKASVYNTKGLNLFFGSVENAYLISYNASGKAVYDKDPKNNAVVVNVNPKSNSTTGFTIKLFDKTGKAVAQQAEVNANHVEGDLVLEKINNDAIQLQIEGLKEGEEAFVCFQVQLEALNPYIDKMDITCTQPSGEQALKNQYLADDFTIGTDGKVDFGVPSNFVTTGLKFAFDGLHSKSADETYTYLGGQEGEYSRYHFVKSDYYNLIDENLQGHRSAAADYDYTKKVKVDVAGDMPFYCNNSDKFKAGTTGSGKFYYEEYRYTNAAYNTQGGHWKEMVVNNGDFDEKCYIVVCDETRYNIAPTTTPRHAIYAYYSTDLKLTIVDYTPEITYTKVYDDAVIPTGPDKNYYVGATLTLKSKGGTALPEGTGYAFTKQIIDQINADIKAHKTNAPVDPDHILYFDASKINSLLSSNTNAAWGTLEDLKRVLGMNALIFLPTGVTDNHDNVASKSLSGDDFIAENNIVLEDQWPFFSPYDIRINAANEVSYKRFVANNNDTKQWVSIVLPFTVAVNTEGQYINEDDKCDFTFFKMNPTNAFSKPNPSGELIFTDIDGHFSPYTGVETTQPNDAYIVRIDRADMTEKDAKLMFILRQRGSTIVKTPVGRTIQGAASSGTVDGQNMTLTPQATFSGAEVDKTKGIFYFNKDKFVSSLALEMANTVKVLPFRSYYDCTGTSTGKRNIRYINISLEPNNATTDIQEVTSKTTNAGFVFSSQAGQLTVKATKDLRVNVRNVSGQTIDVKALKAGESHSVKLPSGIYVVNGTKVMVR